MLAASLENPGLSRPRLNYEPNAPRLLVEVNPEKAAALGVSSQAVGRTLETMFGSRRATTYLRGGQEYDVILQTQRDDRRSVADLESLYVATGSGQLVPLSAVVTTQTSGDTLTAGGWTVSGPSVYGRPTPARPWPTPPSS